ncbi:MAG: C-terminal binding protein [Gemmataceae bacterium]
MTQRPKVIIADYISEPLDEERAILADIAEVVALEAMSQSDLIGRLDDATAVMLYHFVEMDADTISRFKNCKLIVRCGVGVDNIDLGAARAKGIPVANIPDYGTEEVADSAIGMTLALTRGINRANCLSRRGEGPWTFEQVAPLVRLRGKVFGIVGLGRIGTATALRAKVLGMEVVYYDPYAPDGRDKALGVRRVESFEELLSQSYVLSLHCPRTPETINMIDASAITQMPAGSYLVNTARGAIVDTSAVLEAITSGKLAGAALDVLPQEPPADDDPLLVAWRDPSHSAHDRIILNPHCAFYSEQGLLDMRRKGSQNCRRVLLGEEPRNIVN